MATQFELDHMYMKMALAMASISNGVRSKVGAVGVTSNGVVLTGVNGLPTQLGNILEHVKLTPVDSSDIEKNELIENPIDDKLSVCVDVNYQLVTKPTVIHAELNVIIKGAREGVSLLGSTFYTTLSPCEHCASMLLAIGVSRVVYLNEYRITTGVDILKQSGIIVDKLEFVMVEK